MTKSRGIRQPKTPWTAEQEAILRARYPHEKTERIAADLGMPLHKVYGKAAQFGLKKTPEYLASPDAQRLRRGDNVGAACRFQKGHVPANKGVKGVCYEGCKPTQFKPGQKSFNWMPLGSERYSNDGYLQRKVTDTGYPPRDWKGVHILLWEQHNGPVPRGHCVIFKDGDKTNIVLGNLELVSRADLMKRNTIHNLPEELKDVLKLKGALNRRITCHERRNRTQKTPV